MLEKRFSEVIINDQKLFENIDYRIKIYEYLRERRKLVHEPFMSKKY